jgi:hypothetical protein
MYEVIILSDNYRLPHSGVSIMILCSPFNRLPTRAADAEKNNRRWLSDKITAVLYKHSVRVPVSSWISKYKDQFPPFHCLAQNSAVPSADTAVRCNVIANCHDMPWAWHIMSAISCSLFPVHFSSLIKYHYLIHCKFPKCICSVNLTYCYYFQQVETIIFVVWYTFIIFHLTVQ